MNHISWLNLITVIHLEKYELRNPDKSSEDA